MQFKAAMMAAAFAGPLNACAAQAPLPQASHALQSAAEQVAAALNAGDAPSSAKNRATAARTLAALGARPAVPGQPDLVARWLAQEHGADPAPVYRGRMLGPAYRKGLIGAGAEVLIEQVFMAGQLAEVVLSPSNGARLNLTIAGPGGQEVCKSLVFRPQGRCSWRPPFAGRYQVRIKNSGVQDASFFVVVS